tara:strand:- start:297 stop:491 length:195 start_codon:yes stop_codon:yes gene_type:complete
MPTAAIKIALDLNEKTLGKSALPQLATMGIYKISHGENGCIVKNFQHAMETSVTEQADLAHSMT